MGWTWYNADNYKNGKIDKKVEMTCELEKGGYIKVLKSSIVNNVYYGACINTSKPEEVWAIICLLHTNMKDYYNFGYKDMDETCEPFYYDAPKSILSLLTPTISENAITWRKKCLENIEKKKAKSKDENTLNKLPVNTIIEFKAPYDTSIFNKDDTIKAVKVNGRQYGFKRDIWLYNNYWRLTNVLKQVEKYEVIKRG